MRFAACGALFVVFATVAANPAAEPPEVLEVGRFSAMREGESLPAGWEPLVFKKVPHNTSYSLVKDGGAVVVRADSRASASGLVRKIRVDPREYPILEWRWKVMNLIEKSDVRKKSGDDYPARIYVTFEYDPARVGFLDRVKFRALRLLYGAELPIAAINYIWASHAERGAVVANAFTDRVRMIVVESGEEGVGSWLNERRNVLEDYRRAFGDDPPAISGVAIMTDTDNTGEAATAFYGDIVLERR